MPTGFPGTIDNFTNPTAVDNLNTATKVHHDQHTNVNDAVHAIELELGVNTKGAATSVRARMEAIEAALAAKLDDSQAGSAGGLATLDGGGALVQPVPAANMTGTLLAARIPNISGAKILGTGSGGAAIPVDAVPALPASATTSGVFNIARIPTIPLATGVSGVLPASAIPSSVAANANVQVVADVAARDAIPLVNRANGMLVWTRTSPPQLYMWNTTTNLWDYVAGPGVLGAAFQDRQVQWALATGDIFAPLAGAYGNVTGFSFKCKAGFNYAFSGSMFVSSNASIPGVKWGWTWTGTGTMTAGRLGVTSGVSAPSHAGDLNALAVVGDAATPALDASSLSAPAGLPLLHLLEATFICTADATVQLQFSQGTSDPSNGPIAKIGSRMKCERMVS